MSAGDESITERLTAQFCARTLPKAEWTHQAHLRVGLWHVLQFGGDEALIRLREGITRLNESHGTANTDTGGYHETITRFYVWVIGRFIENTDPARTRAIDDLAQELLARYPASDLPLRYYSRERLYCVAARRGWVEPDLAPLE